MKGDKACFERVFAGIREVLHPLPSAKIAWCSDFSIADFHFALLASVPSLPLCCKALTTFCWPPQAPLSQASA